MHNAPKMRAYEKKDYEIDLWFSQEQHKIDMAKIEKIQDAGTAKKEFNASIIINDDFVKMLLATTHHHRQKKVLQKHRRST